MYENGPSENLSLRFFAKKKNRIDLALKMNAFVTMKFKNKWNCDVHPFMKVKLKMNLARHDRVL